MPFPLPGSTLLLIIQGQPESALLRKAHQDSMSLLQVLTTRWTHLTLATKPLFQLSGFVSAPPLAWKHLKGRNQLGKSLPYPQHQVASGRAQAVERIKE